MCLFTQEHEQLAGQGQRKGSFQDGAVEFLLRTKKVVWQATGDPGPITNFLQAGCIIAFFGKQRFSSIKNGLLAGFGSLGSPCALLSTGHGLFPLYSRWYFKLARSLAIRTVNIAKNNETSQEAVMLSCPNLPSGIAVALRNRQQSSWPTRCLAPVGRGMQREWRAAPVCRVLSTG